MGHFCSASFYFLVDDVEFYLISQKFNESLFYNCLVVKDYKIDAKKNHSTDNQQCHKMYWIIIQAKIASIGFERIDMLTVFTQYINIVTNQAK